MVAALSITITGDKAVSRRLGAVGRELAGKGIDVALRAAALIPMNAAKRDAPYITGNLRKSIHVGGYGDGLEGGTTGTNIGMPSQKHAVAVGTNVVYARIIEYGGPGRAAKPYLRPALDNNKREIQQEFADALADVLKAALR